MTAAANPEQMLFASTAQAFLEKEAPLTRVREMQDTGVSFDAGGPSSPEPRTRSRPPLPLRGARPAAPLDFVSCGVALATTVPRGG